MEALRTELKTLIIDALRLDDMAPEKIDDDAPLFGEGLGLDSLDALEIVVALEYRYGFKFKLDAEEGRKRFANITTLTEYVMKERTK
jgi:acyl carrier protein